MLPEPLLTFDKFDALLSCALLPNDEATDARARNVRILLNDLPAEHKCVLVCRAAVPTGSLMSSPHLTLPHVVTTGRPW